MERVSMLRCGLCNSRAEVKSMKYHKSGEYLICKACYEKQFPGSRVVVESSSSLVKDPAEVEKTARKVTYRCKNCSYSFSRSRDHYFENCPYCGKSSVSVLDKGTVQNLIDEVPG